MPKNNNKETKSQKTKVEAPITEVEVPIAEVKAPVSKVETSDSKPKAPKKFAPNDTIECLSITGGELILIGPKTGLQYSWADYGDTSYVEYQDLQALQSMKSTFLTKPRFIIKDDDLIQQWSKMLKPIYDKIDKEDIEELFTLDAKQFATKLKSMPEGLKESIRTKAAQMIQSEELYDVRIIKEIDKALNTEFVEMFLK